MTTINTAPYPAWDGVRPLDWYLLIHQAETIRTQHHLGLASVWTHIRRDYPAARTALTTIIENLTRGAEGAEPLTPPA